MKQHRVCEHAVKPAGRQVEREQVLLPDLMASFAVEYQRLMRNQPGVTVLPAAGLSDLERFSRAGRRVIFVPAAPSRPPAEAGAFEWERVGDLYELTLKPTTRPADAGTGPQIKGR